MGVPIAHCRCESSVNSFADEKPSCSLGGKVQAREAAATRLKELALERQANTKTGPSLMRFENSRSTRLLSTHENPMLILLMSPSGSPVDSKPTSDGSAIPNYLLCKLDLIFSDILMLIIQWFTHTDYIYQCQYCSLNMSPTNRKNTILYDPCSTGPVVGDNHHGALEFAQGNFQGFLSTRVPGSEGDATWEHKQQNGDTESCSRLKAGSVSFIQTIVTTFW